MRPPKSLERHFGENVVTRTSYVFMESSSECGSTASVGESFPENLKPPPKRATEAYRKEG